MKPLYVRSVSSNVWAFALLSLSLVSGRSVHADGGCASDIVKPFVGRWQGSALLIPAEAPQQQSGTRAEFAIVDCQSFEATFNYLDGAGSVVRTIHFTAVADAEQVGVFSILDGTVTDGSGVTAMSGSFKRIQEGTLLGTFLGSIGGKPAYMTELMNVTSPQNGVSHLVRTVQMFAGERGGPYVASRVVNDAKVQ